MICTYTLYRYTDARPSMPSHRHTHVRLYPHVRARTRVWAADNRRWSRGCTCAHQGTRTRLEAAAHMRRGTSLQGIYTYAHAHACTHTYTYTHGDTHLEVARSCCAAARTRTCTHALMHKHAHAPTRTLKCMLRAHAYIHTYAHTHAYIYISLYI